MNKALSYRPDIDGLRALAVLSVVLFHLGGTPLHGGYVGVDIFFVISGYLITSIINREMMADTFCLASFYERRIRRILPALFTVMAATLLFSMFVLFPPDFDYFGEGLAATAAFGSNLLFWQKSGYFEADASTVPLLHTWSLAVEEQFYIFFPLFMMLLHRFLPRKINWGVLIALMASFTVAALAVRLNTLAALFYLLPTRAWELLIGSVLALPFIPLTSRRWLMNVLAITGFSLIFYAVFCFNEDTVFPGPNALFPTVGAALLIYSGLGREGLSYKILGQRLAVFFGKISYSLYLWHWPVIVFFKYASPVKLTPPWAAALFCACFLLSYLSWRFVEQPARHTQMSRKKIFTAALLVSLLFVAVGLGISHKDGFPNRYPKEIRDLYTVDMSSHLLPMTEKDAPANSYDGILGDPKAKASFVVWGDSHSMASSPGIDLIAKSLHKKGYVLGTHSCMPSYVDVPNGVEKCNEVNRGIVQFLKHHPEIKTVILVSYWSSHDIRDRKQYRLDKIQSSTLFKDTLDTLFTNLEKDGRKIVLMIEVPPASVENPPLYIARAVHYGLDMNSQSGFQFDLKFHNQREKGVKETLDSLKETHHFKVVDPSAVFCPHEICSINHDGRTLYKDDNHISRYASEFFKDMYIPLLKD